MTSNVVDDPSTSSSQLSVSLPPTKQPTADLDLLNGLKMSFSGVLWKNMKYISLIVLVAQNAALVLTMRYSRMVTDGKMYLASTAVVLTELLKFTISLSVIFYNNNFDVEKTVKLLGLEIVVKGYETVKVSVPSVLYTIQNNLLYIALTHLNAVTFQVTYQLKILTTAIFSVILLKRSLTTVKWLSLFMLMCAVVMVQWPSGQQTSGHSNWHSSAIGLISILLACVSSGFSGVYIELILKSSDTSMWIRNIQLSILSFFIGLIGVLLNDWEAILSGGFFQGYSRIVIAVIVLQALGGIIVSLVMKYADNILKGFATSLSIVLSSIVSFFVLNDFEPSWNFLFGTILVLMATFIYGHSSPQKVLPTTEVHVSKNG